MIPMASYSKEFAPYQSLSYVIVSRPTAQSIPDTTATTIDFTAAAVVEASTDDQMFDTSTPNKVTIKRRGLYIATANVAFAGNTNGFRVLGIRVWDSEVAELSIPGRAAPTMLSAAGVFLADTNAPVTFTVGQTSGAALDLNEARVGVVLLA